MREKNMMTITISITRTRTLTESGEVEAEVPDEISEDEEKIREYVESHPGIFETVEVERQLDLDDEQIEYDEILLVEDES